MLICKTLVIIYLKFIFWMPGLSVVVVSSLTKILSYFSFLVCPLKFKMHASPIRRK